MKKVVFGIWFPILLLLGCESSTKIDIDQVIEEKVQERLDTYRRVKNESCLEAALLEAGRLADSIILERARFLRDTSMRPYRPFRPGDPVLQELSDSLPLRPLFDSIYFANDTLAIDSLATQDSLEQH